MLCRMAVAAIAATFLIVGCTAQSAPPPTAAVRDDAFLPYLTIATTSFEATQPGGDRIRGHLAARRNKTTGALGTHAVIGVVYAQRMSRRYEVARNQRAEALPMRRLAQDGGGCRRQSGCAHAELYQVDIPEADLRAAFTAGEGYPIKLFARAGHATLFPIPRELVAALVREIDAVRPAPVTPARTQPR